MFLSVALKCHIEHRLENWKRHQDFYKDLLVHLIFKFHLRSSAPSHQDQNILKKKKKAVLLTRTNRFSRIMICWFLIASRNEKLTDEVSIDDWWVIESLRATERQILLLLNYEDLFRCGNGRRLVIKNFLFFSDFH